jgi:hypothetical protein
MPSMTLVVGVMAAVLLSTSPGISGAGTVCSAAESVMTQERSVAALTIPSIPVASTDQPLPFIHTGGCLRFDSGWWSYEFCPGKFLRQFHKEQEAVASEYFLGFGPHALDGDEVDSQRVRYQDHISTMKEQILRAGMERSVTSALRSKTRRAHCRKGADGVEALDQVVVEYAGGTVCDVTKKPRRTSVIYVCDHKQPQILWNITESNCVYTVFVVGRMGCSMMNVALEPVATVKPARKFYTHAKQSDVRRHPSARKLMDMADGVRSQPAEPGTPKRAAAAEFAPLDEPAASGEPQAPTAAPADQAVSSEPQPVLDDSGEELNFEGNMIFSCV